jgi:hypothetical protein
MECILDLPDQNGIKISSDKNTLNIINQKNIIIKLSKPIEEDIDYLVVTMITRNGDIYDLPCKEFTYQDNHINVTSLENCVGIFALVQLMVYGIDEFTDKDTVGKVFREYDCGYLGSNKPGLMDIPMTRAFYYCEEELADADRIYVLTGGKFNKKI